MREAMLSVELGQPEPFPPAPRDEAEIEIVRRWLEVRGIRAEQALLVLLQTIQTHQAMLETIRETLHHSAIIGNYSTGEAKMTAARAATKHALADLLTHSAAGPAAGNVGSSESVFP